jgi:hypothetical protein
MYFKYKGYELNLLWQASNVYDVKRTKYKVICNYYYRETTLSLWVEAWSATGLPNTCRVKVG